MNQYAVIIRGMNPTPWKPARSGGKGQRAMKLPELHAYQSGIKEILDDDPYLPLEWNEDERAKVEFAFFRQVMRGEQDADGHWHHGKRADATNLQKALEDACQGRLFANDSIVTDIHSKVVRQTEDTEPVIVIRISEDRAGTSGWWDEYV